MVSVTSLEPDPARSVLFVGQDTAGHWLVQESHGLLEGRFISFAAALRFARAERRSFPNGSVAVVTAPLTPQISFAPVGAAETALRHAA